MTLSYTRVCTIVWIALLVLTFVSGFLADGMLGMSNSTAAIILLAIAFLKVRLVIIHFMEIGHAAMPLRIALETWILITLAAMLFLYFWSPNAAVT